MQTAYAVSQAIARTEGTIRQLLGHHHGGMFNPTGRRISETPPPNQIINVMHGSPSMLRPASLPNLAVPQAAQAIPVAPPVLPAIAQTVTGTSRPIASRLEAVEMVRAKSIDSS